MALRLKNRVNKGFVVKLDNTNHSIKISQLTDDTTLFLSNKKEIKAAMNEIEFFGSFSELTLNKNKTEGIWIGKLKNSKDKVAGFKWTNKPVKALGIYFGHNRDEYEKLNWAN